jgi:arsenite methyltransferase
MSQHKSLIGPPPLITCEPGPPAPERPGGLALTQIMLDFCRLEAGSRVLEVGCGSGHSLKFIAGHYPFQVVGLDRSASALPGSLNLFKEASLVRANAESLPFPDRIFQALLCECVLSLIDSPELALREFQRTLQRGAYLCLSDVYNRSPGPTQADPAGASFKAALTYPELSSLLTQSGFRIRLWEDHTEDLKQFIFQAIFNGRRDAVGGTGAVALDCAGWTTNQTRRARAGYYLLVAQKD